MTVCEHAHESLELWLGKPFKPFSCSICGWQSGKTKAAFLNKKNMHASLDEEERRQIELDHARDHFWKVLCGRGGGPSMNATTHAGVNISNWQCYGGSGPSNDYCLQRPTQARL